MKHYYDARYQFLWCQTTEEDRIIREHRKIFDETIPFFSWDISAGFRGFIPSGEEDGWVWIQVEIPGYEPPKGPPGLKSIISDPSKALDAVRGLPEGSFIFMKDYHKYFDKISVIREALNLKDDLKMSAKTICFLSASQNIPAELVNDITVIDYPYPNEQALRVVLNKMAEENSVPVLNNPDNIVNAMRGLTCEGAENALALSLVAKGEFDVKTILDQKATRLKSGSILEYGQFPETLDDLYGLEVMKDYIMKTIRNPKARGILLYGVPGSGKSHTAKAVANEMGWPCLILRFSALKDKYQGVAESRLRDAFKTIRAFGRCVVFMDEIEAIAVGISSGGDSGVGQSLFKDLLIELEDSRGCGAYWIGTCNALDPLIKESGGALLRRFNAKFFCDMPNMDEARGIAKIWEKKEKIQIPEDYDFTGYSGANIAELAATMSMMGCSAGEAQQYILPYGVAHKEELEAIRSRAAGVCIWASKPSRLAIATTAKRKVSKRVAA